MCFLIIFVSLFVGVSAIRTDEVSLGLYQQEVLDQASDNSNDTHRVTSEEEDALEYAVTMAKLNCLMLRAKSIAAPNQQKAVRLVVNLFMLDQDHMGYVFKSWYKELKYQLSRGSHWFEEENFNLNKFNDYRVELMMLGRTEEERTAVYKALLGPRDKDLYGAGVELPGLDSVGFDYNYERDKCAPEEGGELYTKIKTYVDAFAEEFKGGECEGGCARFQVLSKSKCGSKPGGRTCPEGAGCTCRTSMNPWAPAVFVGSYIGIFIGQATVLTLVGKPHLIAVMPVDPWALIVTGFFAKKIDGCMCAAKKCKIVTTDTNEEVCGVENGQGDWVVNGVALPFMGNKCIKTSGKCQDLSCEVEDFEGFGRLGVHNGSTYNCWRQFWEDWTYKTRAERFQVYRDQFPS